MSSKQVKFGRELKLHEYCNAQLAAPIRTAAYIHVEKRWKEQFAVVGPAYQSHTSSATTMA